MIAGGRVTETSRSESTQANSDDSDIKSKLKLFSLLFAIGAVFKTPQSSSEMHAAMPRAWRRPTVQVQKVQKIQKFQKPVPSVYY
jgi:hypothetical protein